MQRLADGLTAARVDALLRKWLAGLPHPFAPRDRQRGHPLRHLDFAGRVRSDRGIRPTGAGRVFFEEVLRENLDMGRPKHVQLIFDRRVHRRTPSRYRTRVITDGVIPSLHVDSKHSRIKQYHKEGRALRTETVVNARTIRCRPPAEQPRGLKEIGFAANRRLLGVQRLSHDRIVGADVLDERTARCASTANAPRRCASATGGCRPCSLRCCASTCCRTASATESCHEAVASLCGLSLDDYGTGRMIYDLRRLRLRGLIERIPGTPRHRLTAEGVCVALAYHRTQERVLAPCCRPPSTGTRPHVFGKSSPSTTRRSTALGADRPWLRKPDLQVRKTADRTLIRNLTQL